MNPARPVALVCLLAPAACLETGSNMAGDPLHSGSPTIEESTWGCSVDEGSWSFTVATDRWTGNGRIYMAVDPDYLESHPIRSTSAAPDGSSDHLVLDLTVAADWREASAGSSTAFQCTRSNEETISLRVVVYEQEGVEGSRDDRVADCQNLGFNPELFDDIGGIPPCEP